MVLRLRHKACANWIVFDVAPYFVKLPRISDQMIVTLVLPKRSCVGKNLIGATSGKALERTEPFTRSYPRRDQDMDVIGHDHVSMQLVAVQVEFAVVNRFGDYPRNFGSLQIHRSRPSLVQEAIHGGECVARPHASRGKHPVRWEATVQAEGDEYRLPKHIPVGKASRILSHLSWSGAGTATKISIQDAGQKPGCRLKAWPHI